jgi:replicative DNA helicase Mcm
MTFGFKNVTKTDGKINIYDARVGKYCKPLGKCTEKFVPKVIKSMSPGLIRTFLNAFNQCDGTIRPPKDFKGARFKPTKIYFTTSKRLADDLTELLVKVGKSAYVKIQESFGKEIEFKNGKYTINHDVMIISELNSKHQKAQIVEEVSYDGMVYDLSLEKFHTLLVRRNGRIVWGSNCRTIQRPLTSRLPSHKKLIDAGLAMDERSFTPLPKGWA